MVSYKGCGRCLALAEKLSLNVVSMLFLATGIYTNWEGNWMNYWKSFLLVCKSALRSNFFFPKFVSSQNMIAMEKLQVGPNAISMLIAGHQDNVHDGDSLFQLYHFSVS